MAVAWTPITLDHSFFSLSGGHAPVACEQCHPTPAFQQTSSECVACHPEPEAHWGWYGTACADCHTIDAWTPSIFDHNQLDFSLTGQHAGLECQTCHRNHQFMGTLSECNACHRQPDSHISGQFGQRCQMCHVADGWQPAFLRQHTFPVNHGSPDQMPHDCLVCHPRGYITYSCEVCHGDESLDPALVTN
jgi:hypothetical protein